MPSLRSGLQDDNRICHVLIYELINLEEEEEEGEEEEEKEEEKEEEEKEEEEEEKEEEVSRCIGAENYLHVSSGE
ncbi:hypothetical protein M8J77_013385 [Diaphorina citri]|nr:hypothetical protein M8J77_013385 [Diaphorina citri]